MLSIRCTWSGVVVLVLCCSVSRADAPLVPQVDGEWWTIAGDPDLGPLTSAEQQPVDFAIWQARDGTWQLWSCIRGTKREGKTRILYRWQAEKLTDSDWAPMGIAMDADPGFGETPGGLQAPHVVDIEGEYYLFYGDWNRICLAKGIDGKTFARQLTPQGEAGMFGEPSDSNTRDPMLLRIGDLWHCYYTAHPEDRGAVYCRTSHDLRSWSDSRIVSAGGIAGRGPYSAECPHVVFVPETQDYYLFRTQRYGHDAISSVYRSKDPLDFGVDDDSKLVAQLPIAAPEIVVHDSQYYVASLLPTLKGIRLARLRWLDVVE